MWSRVDDNIPHHPKFLKAGPLASWLWVCGNCYCNRYLTDGFISHEVLPTLGQVPRVAKQAAILVLAGLWDAVPGGYTVHHFHDPTPTAADVKAQREHDRLRKESERNPRGQTTDSAKNPTSPAPAIPIPSQSHPIPSLEEKNAAAPSNSTPAASKSKRPIFEGQRFTVFEWQLDGLSKMLGGYFEEFDLHTWFFDLDARAERSNQVIPQRDGGAWLQAQTLAEATRRGLPIARPEIENKRRDGVTGSTCQHDPMCETSSACVYRCLDDARAARA